MAIGGELTISFKVFLTMAFWLIGKEKKRVGVEKTFDILS